MNLYKLGMATGTHQVVGTEIESAPVKKPNSLTSILVVGVLGMGVAYGIPLLRKKR